MTKLAPKPVPAIDLTRQYGEIQPEIDAAVAAVLANGNYILGQEVAAFEEEFAAYMGAKYAVGVGSGTEALHLSLLALGVGRGDEVITVPNTAVPTVSAISLTGASPVFVDIDPETYTLDTAQLEAAITPRSKAVIPVHLYGNVVEMGPLMKVAGKKGLAVVEDACQAHGAEYKGEKVGTIGNMGAFSFYPTKNLGGYGDGGIIVTNDEALARKVRLLRFYGMADKARYIHVIKGVNSRLDEIQAAVLRVKLKHLDSWNELRRSKAALYGRLLPQPSVSLPNEPAYAQNVYHLYVIRTERRNELRRYLSRRGIGTSVHYPVPVHLQPAYADLKLRAGSFPVTEKCAGEVLSLPMFPELTADEIERVALEIQRFYQVKPDEA
ncbi:MAG: DegT/DnrJ/EryC1/StrS family aminotransferase [Chloroflexota bacterium]